MVEAGKKGKTKNYVFHGIIHFIVYYSKGNPYKMPNPVKYQILIKLLHHFQP